MLWRSTIAYCCDKGHSELALSLILHGASVNEEYHGELPLHTAVERGHSELILSLIEHGASVNIDQTDKYVQGILPITYYADNVKEDAKHFNNAIFTQLIPGSGIDIFKTIFRICEEGKPCNTGEESNLKALSSMLYKLIQYLILVEPLTIIVEQRFRDFERFQMLLN